MNDLERGRLRREWRTVDAMLTIFCRARHGGGRKALCADCRELREYANARLERCPFAAAKPTCANCRVHCYRSAMRERMHEVMRFAGPRMLARHPYLALMHLGVDGRRPAPELRRGAAGGADARPQQT